MLPEEFAKGFEFSLVLAFTGVVCVADVDDSDFVSIETISVSMFYLSFY